MYDGRLQRTTILLSDEYGLPNYKNWRTAFRAKMCELKVVNLYADEKFVVCRSPQKQEHSKQKTRKTTSFLKLCLNIYYIVFIFVHEFDFLYIYLY